MRSMTTIRTTTDTHLPAERVLAAAHDFSERRAKLFPSVSTELLVVHELGPDYADAYEGTSAGIGINWERCRYDWSQPGSVLATVTDSNVYAIDSSWKVTAAQVGKNVHLSGGAGIGGVLEPPNAVPVVVEDDAFVGSRCMVVGGARVRRGATLGAGAILTPTTHVIDVETGDELPQGEAPAWSVCVSGTRARKFPGGEFGMPCLLVLKRLPEGSRHDKATLNAILRDHGVDA